MNVVRPRANVPVKRAKILHALLAYWLVWVSFYAAASCTTLDCLTCMNRMHFLRYDLCSVVSQEIVSFFNFCLGPSYKRGPPKGYIQAVELRLRQVESILATIIASSDPRAQTLIQSIRLDPLANNIIGRVDQGPFGPSARASQTSPSLSQEAFWDAVTQPSSPVLSVSRSARTLRESRVDRENLSTDHGNETQLEYLISR